MRAFSLLCAWLTAGSLACSSEPASQPADASIDDAPREAKVPLQYDAGDAAVSGPDKLSDTGLYSDFASRTLAPGVTPYGVRYPLWSDSADKQRYLLLPPGQKIDSSSMDDWSFPIGTKVWKEFRQGGVLVETRMLWKARADAWWLMAYAWLPDGSDAIAAPNGVPNALGTVHDIPKQVDCSGCHAEVYDTLIGVSAIQLSNGGNGFLAKNLVANNLLTVAPAGEFEIPGTGNVKDALAYMHANCGHCHNDVSHITTQTSLRLRVDTDEPTVNETGVYRTAPWLVMKHVVPPDVALALLPGDPDHSGIAVRMNHRSDGYEMPPLCTKTVDAVGLTTVRTWITSLGDGGALDAGSD